MVVAGMSNKQLASEIGIQQATVKFHRGKVIRKMQADSVPELVRMAERFPGRTPMTIPRVEAQK